MSTISVAAQFKMSVTEVLAAAEAPALGTSGNELHFTGLDKSLNYNASSTPSAGFVIDLSHTIPGGGTTDFDLTAAPLARDISKAVDLTGKKLVAAEIHNNSDAAFTIAPGASNGYEVFGTNITRTIAPGERVQFAFDGVDTDRDAVAAGDKVITIAGTTGKTCRVLLVFSA